jgi:tRNA-dihydrouridine synthase
MVARAVAGDPWLVGALLSGRSAARPPLPVVVEDLRRLLSRAQAEMGSTRAAKWVRKLLTWYLRPSAVPPRLLDGLRDFVEVPALDEALGHLVEQVAAAER